MKSKIFNFISKSNQVLFFLVAIGILAIMIKELIPQRYNYIQPSVKIENISNDTNKSDTQQKTKYTKEFYRRVKDTYIIKLSTSKIVRAEAYGMASYSLDYGYNKSSMNLLVNLIFAKDNIESRRLLDKDAYIKSFSTVMDKINTNHRYNSKSYKLDKNIYSIITKDTNGDNTLSAEDKESFYISDYDGKQLELVMEDTEGYELVGDNLILIIKNENNKKEFYLFSVITKKLKMLDTKI